MARYGRVRVINEPGGTVIAGNQDVTVRGVIGSSESRQRHGSMVDDADGNIDENTTIRHYGRGRVFVNGERRADYERGRRHSG